MHTSQIVNQFHLKLAGPLINSETVISVNWGQKLFVPPLNWQLGLCPLRMSVTLAISMRASNASRHSSIVLIKVYACQTRQEVYENVRECVQTGSEVAVCRRLLGAFGDRVSNAIPRGARVISMIGAVFTYSFDRELHGQPPAYDEAVAAPGTPQAVSPPLVAPYPMPPNGFPVVHPDHLLPNVPLPYNRNPQN